MAADFIHLQSFSTTNRQIDCRLTHPSRLRPTAFDTTLSCPLLPSYLPAATTDPESIFLVKATAKMQKHAAGLAQVGVDFIPFAPLRAHHPRRRRPMDFSPWPKS